MATLGRGGFDAAFRPHAIQTQMSRMLTAAAKPVLSDITLTLPGVEGCELYPYPLPDLFCGLPLLVAGKYSGTWPAGGITLNGRLPNGTRECFALYENNSKRCMLATNSACL